MLLKDLFKDIKKDVFVCLSLSCVKETTHVRSIVTASWIVCLIKMEGSNDKQVGAQPSASFLSLYDEIYEEQLPVFQTTRIPRGC